MLHSTQWWGMRDKVCAADQPRLFHIILKLTYGTPYAVRCTHMLLVLSAVPCTDQFHNRADHFHQTCWLSVCEWPRAEGKNSNVFKPCLGAQYMHQPATGRSKSGPPEMEGCCSLHTRTLGFWYTACNSCTCFASFTCTHH